MALTLLVLALLLALLFLALLVLALALLVLALVGHGSLLVTEPGAKAAHAKSTRQPSCWFL